MSIIVKTLEAKDIPDLAKAFINTVWKTEAAYFHGLLAAQEKGERVFLVARYGGEIAGFLYVNWKSDYPTFVEKGIPEIKDLRVLEEFRRRGIATALMDEAERRIFERCPAAGIGVGLYEDYGPAQRMYARRGYVPDGRGIFYEDKPVRPGNNVFIDDNLLLYLIKEKP